MDLLSFSHLRWDFVYQRPKHLLARAARSHRVFFIEEPFRDAEAPFLVRYNRDGVHVVVPHIAPGHPSRELAQIRVLIDGLVEAESIVSPALWFGTGAEGILGGRPAPAAAMVSGGYSLRPTRGVWKLTNERQTGLD